jgi:dTDP-4-dehydrorhamnose reductase
MRILILGGRGQLGRELARRSQSAGVTATAIDIDECDVTDATSVDRWLTETGAEAVINCAAWTQVDAAESAVDAAYLVNAIGPRVLASCCDRRGILLTHVSTDFVFNRTTPDPIDEWALPEPISVYGASKLAGETEVRHLCRRHQIVRTSWLYGQNGPNFALTVLRLAAERERLRVVADQHGSPTWTGHLAPAILRLVTLAVPGTYHLTNSGQTTWHEFACAVLAEAGVTRPVDPISTADYPTAARRPQYSVLDNRAWRLLGEPALPPWRQGVSEYIAERAGVPDAEAGGAGPSHDERS